MALTVLNIAHPFAPVSFDAARTHALYLEGYHEPAAGRVQPVVSAQQPVAVHAA